MIVDSWLYQTVPTVPPIAARDQYIHTLQSAFFSHLYCETVYSCSRAFFLSLLFRREGGFVETTASLVSRASLLYFSWPAEDQIDRWFSYSSDRDPLAKAISHSEKILNCHFFLQCCAVVALLWNNMYAIQSSKKTMLGIQRQVTFLARCLWTEVWRHQNVMISMFPHT